MRLSFMTLTWREQNLWQNVVEDYLKKRVLILKYMLPKVFLKQLMEQILLLPILVVLEGVAVVIILLQFMLMTFIYVQNTVYIR